MAKPMQERCSVVTSESQQVRFLSNVLFATVYNTTGEMVHGLRSIVDGEEVRLSVPLSEWHKIHTALQKVLQPKEVSDAKS